MSTAEVNHPFQCASVDRQRISPGLRGAQVASLMIHHDQVVLMRLNISWSDLRALLMDFIAREDALHAGTPEGKVI